MYIQVCTLFSTILSIQFEPEAIFFLQFCIYYPNIDDRFKDLLSLEPVLPLISGFRKVTIIVDFVSAIMMMSWRS